MLRGPDEASPLRSTGAQWGPRSKEHTGLREAGHSGVTRPPAPIDDPLAYFSGFPEKEGFFTPFFHREGFFLGLVKGVSVTSGGHLQTVVCGPDSGAVCGTALVATGRDSPVCGGPRVAGICMEFTVCFLDSEPSPMARVEG